MDNNMKTFLEKEIKSYKKSTIMSMIAGFLLSALLIVYFVILNANLNKIVKPEPLAEFLYNETSILLPKLEVELKSSLKSAAPMIAKNIVMEFKKAIPELRRYVQRHLFKITDEAINTAIAQLDKVYEEVIKASKADIIAAEKSGQSITVEHFYKNLDGALNTAFNRRLKDASGEDIFTKLEMAHQQLDELHRKLVILTSKKNLTQRERLEKKFIQSWIMVVGKINKSVDSEDTGKELIKQKAPATEKK